MWVYRQATGEILDPSGRIVGIGYSGASEARNDPDRTPFHEIGPIPCGRYTISAPEDTYTHGSYVLPLTPDAGNNMFGRSGFLIHGDSLVEPGNASRGCIILPRDIRGQIWESEDHNLEVV